MRGPFAIFVKRSGAFHQVVALYQGRGIGGGRRRIARSSAGYFRDRGDALTTVGIVAREIQP